MLANHHNKLLHLNRNIGFALLGMLLVELCAVLLLTGNTSALTAHWVPFAVRATLALVYVALIEGARYILGHMHGYWQQHDDSPETPFAIRLFGGLVQSLALATIAISYWMTGSVWALTLLAMPMVGAFFIHRNRLAVGLGMAAVLCAFVGVALGGPVLLTQGVALLVPNAAVAVLRGLSVIQAIFPALILLQMGLYLSSLVGNSSYQVNRLQSLATTDTLTGMMNRRLLMHQLQVEISRARRHHSALCVALFDVDNFKKINDIYGHQTGDRILKELGAVILNNVRDCDMGGRYGGEEFALILPETRQAEAAELMERIRATIERHVFCLPDNPLTVTISVGLAQMDPNVSHSREDLIHLADAALYEAKQQGRNRVIYGVLPVPKVSYTKTAFTPLF